MYAKETLDAAIEEYSESLKSPPSRSLKRHGKVKARFCPSLL
jgi:hypothetical protein